jgi:uncharacterized membrane protein YfcA
MDAGQVLAVLAAGFGAGVVLASVGAGSLVSFPILLAVGIPPLVANTSNCVGLVPGGLSGSWGYRRELSPVRPLVLRVAATSAFGALLGAAVLLILPSTAFDAIVPVLVLLAATLIAVQPLVSGALRRRAARRGIVENPDRVEMGAGLTTVSTIVGVYGGYFGAAQGVMLMACLALGLDLSLQVVNGLKNVAVLAANVAASVIFVVVGPLDWAVVGLVAVGSLAGGWLGAHVGRRLPSSVFRVLVVTFGYVVGFRLLLT